MKLREMNGYLMCTIIARTLILWKYMPYGFRRAYTIRIIWRILGFCCQCFQEGDFYVWFAMYGPVMNGWAIYIWASWECKHWADMLKLLVATTIHHYHGKKEFASPRPLATIQKNWAKVFESGKHELVEVWAEGKNITMFKLLLFGASNAHLIILHVYL